MITEPKLNKQFKDFIRTAQNYIVYQECKVNTKNEIEFKFDGNESIRVHYVEYKPAISGASIGIHLSDITAQDLLYAIDRALNTNHRDIFVHSFMEGV